MIVNADPMPISMFERYNAKPALLTASSTLHSGNATHNDKEYRYLELDCNIRKVSILQRLSKCWAICTHHVLIQWNIIARKAVPALWDSVPKMNLELGCCIEARDDTEMPEQLLGCAKVSRVSWSQADEFGAQPISTV